MATTPLLSQPARESATGTATAREVRGAAPTAPTASTLGNEFLRAIWIFQAGCALPMLFILGIMAFIQLFESTIPLYDFITYLGNALLAAGIVFLVVVQRRVPLVGVAEFGFEAAKTFFATGMWLWLFLDALLAHNGTWPDWEEQRRRRIMRAVIASILLWRRARVSEGQEELEADIREDTHLLSETS